MEQPQQDLENIKEKLIEQIKDQYDETQANEFISKINGMNDEQFIEFLKQQGLIQEDGSTKQQCVFCSMVSEQIPTTKIGENNSAIAILEINPISQGHTLIIPRKHLPPGTKLDSETLKLSEEIVKKLTSTFKPSKVELIPGEIMGHQIVNALPIYNNETMGSPRKNQTPEGLAELKNQIENSEPEKIEKKEEIEKEPKIEKIEQISEEDNWLPKRIP